MVNFPFSNLIRPLFLPFLVLVLVGLGRWSWVRTLELRGENRARTLGNKVATKLIKGKPVGESIFRNEISGDPQVAYLAIADFRSGYRGGVINTQMLQRGLQDIGNYHRKHGDEMTMAKLIQPGSGFSGEYLDVVSVAFVPPKTSSDQTPVGVLKMGYVIPGHPFGRGYLQLFWGIVGLFLLYSLVVVVRSRPQAISNVSSEIESPESPPSPAAESSPTDLGLEDLEEELEKPEKVEVDEEGRTWKVLFDGESLESFFAKGKWYVSENLLVAQPWGSSLVSTKASAEGNYTFRAGGRKIAGPDGFIVLFVCNGQALAWVLGGWDNTRSEVAGYESTRQDESLVRNKWYDVEVRIESEKIEGYVNGEKKWELERSSVTDSSPDVGFEKGVGVAVWNTLAKFRDLKFLAT